MFLYAYRHKLKKLFCLFLCLTKLSGINKKIVLAKEGVICP